MGVLEFGSSEVWKYGILAVFREFAGPNDCGGVRKFGRFAAIEFGSLGDRLYLSDSFVGPGVWSVGSYGIRKFKVRNFGISRWPPIALRLCMVLFFVGGFCISRADAQVQCQAPQVQCAAFKAHGSRFNFQLTGISAHSRRPQAQCSRFNAQGSRPNVQKPRFGNQRCGNQVSVFNVQGSTPQAQCPSPNVPGSMFMVHCARFDV